MKILKRFIAYYKAHLPLFYLDMTCALLLTVVDLCFPLVTRQFINVWIPNKNINFMIYAGIALIILFILRMVFNYIIGYYGHTMGTLIEFDMRKDLFSHIETLPYQFFSDQKIGQIINRFVGDLRDIAELSHHGPEDLLISTMMFAGSFIILYRIQPILTLIVFFFMLLLVGFSVLRRKSIEKAFNKVRVFHGEMNARIESSISGIRLTKSFTNEEFEIEKFDEINVEYRNSFKSVYKAIAIFMSGNGFFIDLLNLSVILVGGYFAILGRINIGDLAAYILYAAFIIQPIRRLMMFVEMYESGLAGFRRFIELMDIEPEIKNSKTAVELKNCKGNILLDKVTFRYQDGNYDVLSNLTLTINHGENFALVGPSGVGKTTIANLIPRFYDVINGSIKIDNIDIRDYTLESLRQNIGIVQQDVIIFWGSIKDNILYGKTNATDEEITNAAKQARIYDFVESLPDGLNSFVGEHGVKLSGGQKQRIAIARVFLKNPPILILDEATSSLDNETEAEIQKAIEALSKDRTTITIAHRLSTIQNANTIVVLNDEGIIEMGKHEELLAKDGYYKKLFKAQYKGFIPDKA
jgi:ATP-binding cassette, subfamily B, bacterial